MTNFQQGLNDLALAGVIGVGFLLSVALLSGVYKLIKFTFFKIKINHELKRDHLQSLGLRK